MKKLALLTCFFCLSFGQIATAQFIAPPTSNYIFEDISDGHKNFRAINLLKSRKVIQGYPNGNFGPDNQLNRAELLKILVESKVGNPGSSYANCFPDVRDEWFAPYVCYAKMNGIVSGYPDGTFGPANPVKKVEAIKMITGFYQLNEKYKDVFSSNTVNFNDVNESEWYYPFLKTAYQARILEQQDGDYGPASFISRAEVSENIYRSMMINERKLDDFSGFMYIPLDSDESLLDCQSDFSCFTSNAASCGPTKVVYREDTMLDDEKFTFVHVYESLGRENNECYLRDSVFNEKKEKLSQQICRFPNNELSAALDQILNKVNGIAALKSGKGWGTASCHSSTKFQFTVGTPNIDIKSHTPVVTPTAESTSTPSPTAQTATPSPTPSPAAETTPAPTMTPTATPTPTPLTLLPSSERYYKSNGEIALVCDAPCPVYKEILDSKFNGLKLSAQKVKEMFKVDFKQIVLPVEMYVSASKKCPWPTGTVTGYYNPKKASNNIDYSGGSDICLHLYEKDKENTLLHPFTVENADKIETQALSVHELGHALLDIGDGRDYLNMAIGKYQIEEPIVKATSFYYSGISKDKKITTLCDDDMKNMSYLYDLCKNHGFDFKDFPKVATLFDVNSSWYKDYLTKKHNLDAYIGNTVLMDEKFEENKLLFIQLFWKAAINVEIPTAQLAQYIKNI